jgi:hypothetical protein
MKILITHDEDPREWDELAAALGGGFFHCHAGVRLYARMLQAKPLFVRAADGTGRCVGIAGGMMASSRIWPFSRFCRVATFQATPVAGGDERVEKEFLQALERKLRRRGVFRLEFNSYHSLNSDPLLRAGNYVLTPRCEYDFDLRRSLDDLFGAFAPGRRKDVRKAEKHGVTVREETTTETVDMVRTFHNASMERRDIEVGPAKETVVAARHELVESGRVRVLVSFLNEQPVGACLFGLFNGLAYGLEGGSTERGNHSGSVAQLFWVAIQQFKEQGFRCMSLGGAKEHEEGLRRFKQWFGTIETPQPAGYRIISRFGSRLNALRERLRGRR